MVLKKLSRLLMCRVVRHTIQALPFRSMLDKTIQRDKTVMHDGPGSRSIRILLFLVALLIAAPQLQAQTTAIEPCPAGKPETVATPTKVGAKATKIAVDSGIANDPAVDQLLNPYEVKVKELSSVIGRLDGDLIKRGVGAGTVGQFVTDAMLAEARKMTGKNIAVAVTNAGGLRKNDIAKGDIRASDIFELLPFENELITVDISGEQLAKLLLLSGRDAQSGARVQFKYNDQNRVEVIGAKLIDANDKEQEIDSARMYTIVTIDYLYKLNSGNYALLREGKNLNWLKVTIRDAVTAYVKSETAAGHQLKSKADDRFVQIGPGPATQGNPEK